MSTNHNSTHYHGHRHYHEAKEKRLMGSSTLFWLLRPNRDDCLRTKAHIPNNGPSLLRHVGYYRLLGFTQETACWRKLKYAFRIELAVCSGLGTGAAEPRRRHALPARATTDGPRRPPAAFDFCTPPRPNPRRPPVQLWTAARHRCLLGCGSHPLPRPSFSGRSACRPRREQSSLWHLV